MEEINRFVCLAAAGRLTLTELCADFQAERGQSRADRVRLCGRVAQKGKLNWLEREVSCVQQFAHTGEF